MSEEQGSLHFRANSVASIADESLRAALRNAADTFGTRRTLAFGSVPDLEALREKASAIRMEVLDNLPGYVDTFAANAARQGATVHRASDAQSACDIVGSILTGHGITMAAKGKSMVSEEIGLNHHLQRLGIEVVETDLGEYIIQLEGETPSHIIVPAIHKNRKQVGKLFSERLGVPYTEDPQVLTKTARKVMREKFLAAKAGISGANFAIADTGSLVLFTNEGNGRMVTSLPPLHVAVLSIEKILPKLTDLPTFIRLLPRSATGQAITSYVSLITGTRKAGEATGAKELHIVLVDNGRSSIVKGECREMLKCIRCGACMNVCPVYRTVGGHAYGWTYPGPMGMVLTTLLTGMENSYPLVDASTLCGACVDVCPVRIPLVELIVKLREERVRDGLSDRRERIGMRLFGAAAAQPALFGWGEKLSRLLWPVIKKVGGEKVAGRLPEPAARPFHRRMP
ncbi:LutB/LldF family L-lactate oxidation iron-sulfur protein [Geomonas sp. RF6]|uniref:LutB/LldF family L-lactate oxidation iron-sulfur protein n=1 Tax=Geomonas sp. RF6 TaxID=2897342 RepID=UPI001E44B2E3|nr:LutB/LldF family L-lactate oxidation iron-sulfur protein [Geomonas sp. RF6]UFS69002.1 LutB/LldF family L-lactate oxidation iron-sulfur protein [Geomonas sp. RF6]